jgi:hypothetical protein
MTTFALSELESALEKWQTSTGAARKGPWNRNDGFWLVSEPRQVHFRLCFRGSVEMELLEGPACKVAPVSSVHQAVQLVDVFLRQRCGFDELPDGDWKSSWKGRDVPATLIDHPERITVEEIDSQPDRGLRTALIERYGVDRYWHDTKRNQTGFIHAAGHVANVVENWRASTGARVEVVREILFLCEGDPRNYEEMLLLRSGSREVLFGEPNVWRDYRVLVRVSEGDIGKVGYVSRREEVERLLDLFLRQQCRLEELPDHGWEEWSRGVG